MIITPGYATEVFNATQGLDPLFAPIDGANFPQADMSTLEARQASCSMLLTRGLFRIGIPMLPNAEFTLDAVDDPYGYANAHDVSCFRRPMPATNLRFLSTVMWDGRELLRQKSVLDALAQQARDAIKGHMQAQEPPTDAQVAEIVDFETHLYTSQIYDLSVGNLNTRQLGAGPVNLIALPFFLAKMTLLGWLTIGSRSIPMCSTFMRIGCRSCRVSLAGMRKKIITHVWETIIHPVNLRLRQRSNP